MHVIEVGSQRPKSLSIQVRSERLIARSNKERFCHEMGSGRKRMHWVYPVMVVVEQPMGLRAFLKECPRQTKNSW